MTTTSTSRPVRIALIGVGNMGSTYIRTFLKGDIPHGEIVALCDSDPNRLTAFPDVPGWTDVETMLREAELDAIIVTTPHYQHVPLGKLGLEAGLHVLVDKPIAVHKAAAEELIAAHKNPQQIFAAMFNQRTDPRYQWIREKIHDGTLGRINRVHWTITDWFRTAAYYRNGAWRATWAGEGGGVLLNQCPHQLDLWQWLFGMPSYVRAFIEIGRFHDIEVEDDVTAYLKYADGMNGVFTTTTGEAPGSNRLEIAAENGRLVLEGDALTLDRNLEPTSDFCANAPGLFDKPSTEREIITFDHAGEQHTGILKNFVATILGTENLLAPAAEGLHSVELGNAMLYSGLMDQGIHLPLDGEAYGKKLRELIDQSTFVKPSQPATIASAEDMGQSF